MMNRALVPEMLHCTDMTVLERQRARFKPQPHHHLLQFHHHQQQQQQNCFDLSGDFQFHHGFQGDLGEIVIRSVKPDPNSMDTDPWTSNLLAFPPSVVNHPISRTSSCPPAAPAPVDAAVLSNGRDSDKLNCDLVGRESFKKRKVNSKVIEAEEEGKEKRVKAYAEDGDSKITTEKTKNKSTTSNSNCNSNSNSNKENSGDNSKITEVQKPDYIHVRARRGQATDSHSLAERVRREKISERMKYLQDLVPGCNKITGKAGMLDEIINYVQSLQRQVEFLSMKLAAVNPRLDFNIDNLFAKEIFPPCGTNLASIGMSTTDHMTNTEAYLQFNQQQQQQQLVECCGLEMGINLNPPDLSLRRTISAPVSNPETFIHSSCFNGSSSSNWDGDLQNLYNVGFDEGRSTSFPTQPYTGSIETSNNLKMEM